MQEDVYSRLGIIESKLEEHGKKLDSQLEKNETLVQMKTLMSIQLEDSKKRDVQIERFGQTLDKVNENLTHLNVSQQQMKADMNEIGNRVNDIEKFQEEGKIDTVKLVKSILSYVATGAGSIAIAVLIWLLTDGK